MNFDQRFSTLLRKPVKIDYNKPPPAVLKLEKSSKRKKQNQDLSEESRIHGTHIINQLHYFAHNGEHTFKPFKTFLWSMCQARLN